jgi:NADPH2:quinone reductase
MKAMVIEANQLSFRDVPDPVPGEGELLLAVRAAGLNRADLALKSGHYEKIATRPPAPIAGLEAAGEVIAVGAGVQGFGVGDRVMGMPSGSYAEKALLHHRLALRVPKELSWEEAAALPVALFTAHDALVTNAALRKGEAVLIQGATTGVGIVAAQIARLRGSGIVMGTSRSPEKLLAMQEYGLTGLQASSFPQGVLEATDGKGADVILDLVGAAAAAGHLQCAAVGARWIQIGRMSGAVAEIDLNELSRKRVHLIGVTFRSRTLDEFAAVVQSAARDLGEAVAARKLRSPVDRVFPLARAAEAHERMRANVHLGKIVLKV